FTDGAVVTDDPDIAACVVGDDVPGIWCALHADHHRFRTGDHDTARARRRNQHRRTGLIVSLSNPGHDLSRVGLVCIDSVLETLRRTMAENRSRPRQSILLFIIKVTLICDTADYQRHNDDQSHYYPALMQLAASSLSRYSGLLDLLPLGRQ